MELLKSEIPFTIHDSEISQGPFPANGFLPLFETDFGNGDYYGLYWPIGLENERLIVCELFHDEWRLAPVFSNALILAECLEMDNDCQDDDSVIDDPLLGVVCPFHRKVQSLLVAL
ncbi:MULTISPECIES: hypothetical protein [Enterobacterales]|uniref:Uncharacterized protein n=4 Tax=Morganellaceae TaxID=1903414 RepID=A0A899NN60_PROST|nr:MULTISPECIES: hypothetical protein [Enterobacterales]QHP74633.1 hypothetical protein EKQ45_00995 [Proteus vulgaris]ELL8908922.1 hypothetical protein [Proteus mirabilis]ELQ1458627.1 hypothetical protein [Providencia rettgeri]ELR5063884.1 hypothetical protein [Providencia rettgeri]ELR5098717.1 hypothetical protein [Providencia rettgeri]